MTSRAQAPGRGAPAASPSPAAASSSSSPVSTAPSTTSAAPLMRRTAATIPADFNVLAVMEDICDKLKILDYENKFCPEYNVRPLSRVFFAFPNKSSTAEQFSYFSSLVNWLFKELGVDFIPWGDEYDDPGRICTTISEALRKMGVEMPATKLRLGHGESVCFVLNFLLDRLLTTRKWKPQMATYKSQAVNDELIEEDQAATQLGGDAIEEEVGVDDHAEDTGAFFSARGALEEKVEEKTTQEILESKINPKQWAEEMERVRSRLKFKSDAPSKEWRTHIEQGTKHAKLLGDESPNTKASLAKIEGALRKAIERITAKERHINKEFDHLGSDFKDKQRKHDQLQEQLATLSRQSNDLNNELQSRIDAIEQIKQEMKERNNAMSDVTPLRKIQSALQALKKENAQMELRIGIVNQTLLQAKLKSAKQNDTFKSALAGNSDENDS